MPLSAASSKEETLLCVLLISAALSVLSVAIGGGELGDSVKEFARFLEYGAVFYCLLRLIPDRGSVDEIERLLIGIAVLCSFLGIFQFLIGPATSAARFPWGPWWTEDYDSSSFRVYSVFTNPIYFSAFCSFASPLTLERTFRGRRINWFYAGCLSSILAA